MTLAGASFVAVLVALASGGVYQMHAAARALDSLLCRADAHPPLVSTVRRSATELQKESAREASR